MRFQSFFMSATVQLLAAVEDGGIDSVPGAVSAQGRFEEAERELTVLEIGRAHV